MRPVKLPEPEVIGIHNQREYYDINSVERKPLNRPKNFGKLGKPKEVNVVKNSKFESTDNLEVVQFLNQKNVQASIGSTIHQRGTINSTRRGDGS